jgi:SNF2 family DNA or RNA helicase
VKPLYESDIQAKNLQYLTWKGQEPKAVFAQYLAFKKPSIENSGETRTIIVIGKHRYYNLFSAQLVEAALTSSGELKTPFNSLNPIDLIWQTQQPESLKFYASLIKFGIFYEKSPANITGLQALIHNPFKYTFYLHDDTVSEKINRQSILPIQISQPIINVSIKVNFRDDQYVVTCEAMINGSYSSLARLRVRFDYFLVLENSWFLCSDLNLLSIIGYFKKHQDFLTIKPEHFLKFQQEVLQDMETYVKVEHTYMKPATKKQLQATRFSEVPERLIYLSDLENYVMINPVMKYGEIEIPVLTKRQIYAQDTAGNLMSVARDGVAEDTFMALLVRQHPDFLEQLENPLLYFYLHKSRFLDENWFLKTFEEWREQQITILGFNEIKGNKLNSNKAKINIVVSSGLNWFNANLDVRFGKKKASLKQLHKSVKNKNKFVLLDDGTMGIIPEEWLRKFESYFQTGEVVEENLLIPKVNFAAVAELYEAHMFDEEVTAELDRYHTQIATFNSIPPVAVPEGLVAVLRPYQLQGLSWLNFLDELNFGGCLADDMGLGKSVQIIAFILLLKAKAEKNVHLLVVPTSLIHNWEIEFQKFAPGLKLHLLYGTNREKSIDLFGEFDVIITSYNTLVTDIAFLKNYMFSYIFLDESQNIKNVESQRYKAARLLKSRNRIVISGTPFENNTFDIYAQFSFACPGLLGSKQYFKNTYAISIDKFQHRHSATALQKQIRPFILRRTKKEVAKELPEKTEMVLYCEMGAAQRQVYDMHEREFREYISVSREEEISKNAMNVLKGITRLRQICNSPLLLGEEKITTDASAKIETLLEQLRNITPNHKVLIFSQFVSMLNLIRNELVKEKIKHTYLTGSTRNRSEVINQFQTDDETRVFLISLKAGGTGLNLTAADYVFLVDPWWNPAVENQAIDRCYRIGQQKNVIAVRLLCPNTVEDKIQRLQQNKTKLADNLISTDENAFRSFSKQDWLHLTDSFQIACRHKKAD